MMLTTISRPLTDLHYADNLTCIKNKRGFTVRISASYSDNSTSNTHLFFASGVLLNDVGDDEWGKSI